MLLCFNPSLQNKALTSWSWESLGCTKVEQVISLTPLHKQPSLTKGWGLWERLGSHRVPWCHFPWRGLFSVPCVPRRSRDHCVPWCWGQMLLVLCFL